MSAHASRISAKQNIRSKDEVLARGRQVLRSEIVALEQLYAKLDGRFVSAAEALVACQGSIIVTGIGKAGIVAQKFSASLSSTGTPSHFLHAAEAVHGDIGCIRPGDAVVVFSFSGETEEVTRLIPLLKAHEGRPKITAVTASTESTLASNSDFVVPIGKLSEACSLGLAPTSSTTLMLAVSDALALVASESNGFSRQQFARFHPAGNLGRQLTKVVDTMRPIADCRVASHDLSVRDVFIRISRPGRRTGAIMLLNEEEKLVGIFTDSDLARILEKQNDLQLDRPVAEVMTRDFHTISADAYLTDAVQLIADYKISELPVVAADKTPLGLIDITDVVDIPRRQDVALPFTDRKSTESKHESEAQGNSLGQVADTTSMEVRNNTGDSGVPRILSLIKYQKESR